jgi:hypothetical protein
MSNNKKNNIGLDIHSQEKDTTLKEIADIYPFSLLNILNLFPDKNTTYTQTASELATIQSYRGLPDKVFLSNDNKILVLEFDSSGKTTDLRRYLLYAAHLSAKFSTLSRDNF